MQKPDPQTTIDRAAHADATEAALRDRAERTRAHIERRHRSAYCSDETLAALSADADLFDAAAFYIRLGLARGALQ